MYTLLVLNNNNYYYYNTTTTRHNATGDTIRTPKYIIWGLLIYLAINSSNET